MGRSPFVAAWALEGQDVFEIAAPKTLTGHHVRAPSWSDDKCESQIRLGPNCERPSLSGPRY